VLNEIKINDFTFKVWTGAFNKQALLQQLKKEDVGAIVVFGFDSFGIVDLSEEMAGVSKCLKPLSELSALTKSTIFAGIKTQILNVKHISVAVCGRGKVLDIVDRSCNILDDEYGASDKLKIFSSSFGMIGLLVDSDCLVEKTWQKVAPNCSVMLCVNRGSSSVIAEEVRLFSAAYNIPYIYMDDQGVEWNNLNS